MQKAPIVFLLLLLSFVRCDDEDKPFTPVDRITDVEAVDYYGTFNQFVRLSNGDYFICGGATFGGDKPAEMLMLSIDNNHQVRWRKAYQEVESYINPSALSVCEVATSTYLVAAALKSPDSFDHFIGVMNIDGEGILSAPTHLFPVAHTNYWARILADGKGGYFVSYLEEVIENLNTIESSLIVKHFNSAHVEHWTIVVEDLYWQPAMQIASNGDILVAGSSYPEQGNIENRELTAARITASGQIVYKRSFGGPGDSYDVGFSVAESLDGGSIVAGQLSYTNTPVLFPLDAGGIIGQNLVLDDTMHIYKNEVQKLSSGYLVTNVFSIGNAKWVNLIKTDEALKKLWSYDHQMEPTEHRHVHLINSVTEPDGSVSIAMEEDFILRILTTVPL